MQELVVELVRSLTMAQQIKYLTLCHLKKDKEYLKN